MYAENVIFGNNELPAKVDVDEVIVDDFSVSTNKHYR